MTSHDGATQCQQQKEMMTEQNPIDRLRAAIDSHDPERVAACFAPNYVSELPHQPDLGFIGSGRVADNWTMIFTRFPDIRASVLRRAQQDAEWWSEWEFRATHDGAERVVLAGPVVMTTHDGLIAWSRFYISAVTRATPSV
jgi:hypothetical protein